jgi:hypothetical protein
MDVPADIIGLDYALTRIGVEPYRDVLLPAALNSLSRLAGMKVEAKPGHVNLEETISIQPGMKEFLSMEAGIMVDFLKYLHDTCGGACGYLTTRLGFTESDIRAIRGKLTPKP